MCHLREDQNWTKPLDDRPSVTDDRPCIGYHYWNLSVWLAQTRSRGGFSWTPLFGQTILMNLYGTYVDHTLKFWLKVEPPFSKKNPPLIKAGYGPVAIALQPNSESLTFSSNAQSIICQINGYPDNCQSFEESYFHVQAIVQDLRVNIWTDWQKSPNFAFHMYLSISDIGHTSCT